MAQNTKVGNFYEKPSNKKKDVPTTAQKNNVASSAEVIEYFSTPADITEADELYASESIDGLPLGVTNGDVLNKLIQLSDFNSYGKIFGLMKIIPHESRHDEKIPWNYDENRRMNWSNPQDSGFMSLQEALIKYYTLLPNKDSDKYLIGMLVKPPFMFLDVDDIPDEMNEPSERLKKLDELTANTYSEVSISGNGAHFIFKTAKDVKRPANKNQPTYELYSERHWVALTTKTFLGVKVKTLNASQLDSLTKYLWGDPKAYELNLIEPASAPINEVTPMSTRQVLYKIRHSKNAEKFENLWEGGNDGYTTKDGKPDASAGDQALCNLLAFWCGRDFDLMKTLFKQSPRYKNYRKDKWEKKHYANGETYGDHTLRNAIDFVPVVYTGSNAETADKLLDPNKDLDEDYPTFANNKELTDYLTAVGKNWLANNTDENGHKLKHIPDNAIIDILCQNEQFRMIYASELVKNDKVPLYAYDWNVGIYRNDDDFIRELIQSVDSTCTRLSRQKDIIGSLKTNPRYPIQKVADIRADKKGKPRFVHVRNGIYDLAQQKLLQASPEYAFTSYVGTDYNDDAFIEPNFNGWSLSHFLKEVAKVQQPDGTLKYDPKKYRLLWEIICAGVLGIAGLRKAAIFVDNGQGKSGKSTLLQLIRNVVGSDNTATLTIEDMANSQALVQAENKVLIASDENETNITITKTANFKKMVGLNPVNIKRLYENMYSTIIHAFIIEASNAMPKFSKATQSVFERLIAVKFNTHFDSSKEENTNVQFEYIYDDTLLEWILYHCLHDVKLGASLTETAESHELLSESSGISDPLNGFANYIKDRCDDFDKRIPVKAMYALYCAYFFNLRTSEQGLGVDMPEKPLNKNAFTGTLRNNAMFDDLYSYHKSMRLNEWDPNGLLTIELERLTKKLPAKLIKAYHLGYTLTADQIKSYNSSLFERKATE